MIVYSVGIWSGLYSCSHGQRYTHWGRIWGSHQVQFTFRFVSTCYQCNVLFPSLTITRHWRSLSKSHLFLQHILLHHLENGQVAEAVSFASYYKNLVFFAHSLEILLHTVVESDFVAANNDVESSNKSIAILPTVADFLDHFDTSLDVVVGCARKTELTRWPHLFNVVGTPKSLFEVNLYS